MLNASEVEAASNARLAIMIAAAVNGGKESLASLMAVAGCGTRAIQDAVNNMDRVQHGNRLQ